MPVRLYLDHSVEVAILQGLRKRGVDVIRAYDDGAHEMKDSALLMRARRLDRVLFTYDHDFLKEAAQLQQNGESFAGVIYVHPEKLAVGQIVEDLEILAQVGEAEDLDSRVTFLPL